MDRSDRRKIALRATLKNAFILLREQVLEVLEEELILKKRCWTRPWISRLALGQSTQILRELEAEDPEEYKLCMRMSPDLMGTLLALIGPDIQKSNTMMRDAIPAKVKLEITITYLVCGCSFRLLQRSFRVSRPAISNMIPEVCDAIYKGLKDHIKVPSSNQEWKTIEEGFRKRWNFPKCYGAIDGKHFNTIAPPNSGSQFFNYKKQYSIVLLALVDHDYCFSYLDVGANGMASDGGVFNNCSLSTALENRTLIPEGGVIVGDDAFPLKPYLMKPYSRNNLIFEEKVFNYRLSRARRIVENAFGILVSRFQIFRSPMTTKVETSDKIILATCALHNWLRRTNKTVYTPRNYVDFEDVNTCEFIPGRWREANVVLNGIERTGGNRYSNNAKDIRDEYKNYFSNEGAVPWQNKMIN